MAVKVLLKQTLRMIYSILEKKLIFWLQSGSSLKQLEPFSEKSRRQMFLVRNRWFQTFWLLSIKYPEENYIQSHYTHSCWVGNTTHMLAWNVLRLVRELNTRWSWELIVVKVIGPNTFQRFRLQECLILWKNFLWVQFF